MKNSKDVLQTYVGDMIAAERHLLEVVRLQFTSEPVRHNPVVHNLLSRLENSLDQHLIALDERLQRFGVSLTRGIKEALTSVSGATAGVINKIRPQTASKALRDDYAALAYLSIAYTMLHTTALALHDAETADLALRHMKEINPFIMEIGDLIPSVVVHDLADDVPTLDTTVVQTALDHMHAAWHISSGYDV